MSGSHRSFMGAFLKSNKYLTLLGGKKKNLCFVSRSIRVEVTGLQGKREGFVPPPLCSVVSFAATA